MKRLLVLLLVFSVIFKAELATFPDSFYFGTASSSYQIEGGWDADGKGENIWDRWTHTSPQQILDRTNGDVASDSYHLYERDVEMLDFLGVDFYRFSISWARILPTGFPNKINQEGLLYYHRLIDKLLEAKIVPLVTMYHWELPQVLQDLGGWANREMVDYFEIYARIVFDNFGNKVKNWITFNEPKLICLAGYGSDFEAPGINSSGIADYLCSHNVLLAHARVFHLYKNSYKAQQNGRVGISISVSWFEPATNNKIDIDATERAMQFWAFGWHVNPIFSKNGDYPQLMIDIVGNKSLAQGFLKSRLPVFTSQEKRSLIGSADFLGINYYTTELISDAKSSDGGLFYEDVGIDRFFNSSWENTTLDRIKAVPWGLTKILNYIRTTYDNPVVLITENGCPTTDAIDDFPRIKWIRDHLNAILDALDDGCDVKGYTYWSLMDSFEWNDGYTQRFGLHRVNFSSPMKTRTIRASGHFYKNYIAEARKSKLNYSSIR